MDFNELSQRRIPLIAIVGEQEAMNQTVNLRCLGEADPQAMTLIQLEDTLASLSTVNPIS